MVTYCAVDVNENAVINKHIASSLGESGVMGLVCNYKIISQNSKMKFVAEYLCIFFTNQGKMTMKISCFHFTVSGFLLGL